MRPEPDGRGPDRSGPPGATSGVDPVQGVAARVAAPAKVNLLLRVLHRRPDGFHEVETVFQAVSLADAVEVELREEVGVTLELDGPDLGPPEDNLAVRAARGFVEATGLAMGVRVALRKEIPAGAGLGGGSSDAAAVLRALSRLTGSPLPPEELRRMGASLGSDVPFFLGGSPLAAARGRGELLSPWTPLPATELVLVLPPVHVVTGEAYAALARSRADGEDARHTASVGLPDPPAGWPAILDHAANDFQEVVAGRHGEVARALAALEEVLAGPVLLSGSGGACLGFLPRGREGEGAVATLEESLGWPVRRVRTLERFPPVQLRDPDGP